MIVEGSEKLKRENGTKERGKTSTKFEMIKEYNL